MFADTDSADDRTRILKQVDSSISAFLKLVNDCYRLEMQLRFKAGVRQDKKHKEKNDAIILRGLQLIDTYRTVIVEENCDPASQFEEVSSLSPQVKQG